jgi:rare lipoprotein A
MMKKNPFTITTSLLSFSINLYISLMWQIPSYAQINQKIQNKPNFSPIKRLKLKTISHKNPTNNQKFSPIKPSELADSTDLSLPAAKLKFPPATSTQIAQGIFQGRASWYGPQFHGRRTANGEIFNSNDLTAAHRSLPFGTKVRVTNINNGRSVVVRINDRGPFIGGRIIDLSAGAARILNMVQSGVAPVQLEILGR